MSGFTVSKLTDFITQLVAIALAAICLVFAGYKVMKLRGMENPPADMGLNFPAPRRKIITDDGVLVDPMPTGSIAALPAEIPRSARIQQPYWRGSYVRDYRLVTVIDGVAFVEVKTPHAREIVTLVKGALLPGAGPVERITPVNGRWMLTAGEVTLRMRSQ